MIGKLVVWGATRDVARRRMMRALDEFVVEGVPTTLPFHRLAMAHPDFIAARHSTVSVEREWDLSGLERPDGDGADPHAPADHATPSRDVALTISGRVHHVTVHGRNGTGPGSVTVRRRQRDSATARRTAAVDHPELRAPMQGTIVLYAVEAGTTVSAGDLVCVIEAMKMENHVVAHRDGIVTDLARTAGEVIEPGSVVARIEDV
jgi:acetyl-CoA/propionyl-CoA carboxylase biotin carboxyl carrier protein